jgi:chromosome segregation ATPase
MTTDITSETVARRYTVRRDGRGMTHDVLGNWVEWFNYAHLAARLAEVEALLQHGLQECARETVRAEAAEALLADATERADAEHKRGDRLADKLTASEAREAKLREDLARSKRLRDQYREALDAELKENKP